MRIHAGPVAILVALLLGACSSAPDAGRADESPVDESLVRGFGDRVKLTWKDYDGTGDPGKARYLLGGREIGIGEAGVNNLRKCIPWMKEGTEILIMPYYGDPGSGKDLKYPFDTTRMGKYAKQHGVSLLVPAAG